MTDTESISARWQDVGRRISALSFRQMRVLSRRSHVANPTGSDMLALGWWEHALTLVERASRAVDECAR